MKRYIALFLFFVVALGSFSLTSVKRSWAFCFCTSCQCSVISAAHTLTRNTVDITLDLAFEQFIAQYVNNYLVRKHWWPALRKFTEQVNMSAEKAFVELPAQYSDARKQKAAQDLIAQQKIDAIIETMPDEETCSMASLASSLAYSIRMSKASHSYLQQQGLGRSLALSGSTSSRGSSQERLLRFQESAPYFDNEEMNGALSSFAVASTPRRKSADIYPHTLFGRKTLNIDYQDTTRTDDEADIFMLKSNLYNDTTITGIAPQDLANTENYDEFDEIEVLAAFQAMAEYSYDYIVSLKVMGDNSAAQVLPAILRKLGATDEFITSVTGGSDRPSYMQTLEVLSKTMQTSSLSHINNSGETAELLRRMAIKEGVELMVKFEILQSHKRAAALATALHELERRKLQDEWQNSSVFLAGGK